MQVKVYKLSGAQRSPFVGERGGASTGRWIFDQRRSAVRDSRLCHWFSFHFLSREVSAIYEFHDEHTVSLGRDLLFEAGDRAIANGGAPRRRRRHKRPKFQRTCAKGCFSRRERFNFSGEVEHFRPRAFGLPPPQIASLDEDRAIRGAEAAIGKG